jgi:hypothetical protein
MKQISCFCAAALLLAMLLPRISQSQDVNVSSETEECLECHEAIHSGLVASWRSSRHSFTTPEQALTKPELERRVSSASIDGQLRALSVGCYECHSLNTDKHSDSFEHNGYVINVVVSSDDCATCHAVEAEQYSANLMAHAHSNLVDNSLYQDLSRVINNSHVYVNGDFTVGDMNMLTEYESCLYCHGTRVEVTGQETKNTDFGEFEFPVLSGWPNQGVGRINPDESRGACTACHPRHDFSIETARKPYTCSECHKGPDVPAFKVYEVSKHGNIFFSKSEEFEFTSVPWVLGTDFTVPTCATCHVSLVVSPDNAVIAERSHRFNDRLSWRLFGVPYAHPHPTKPALALSRNSAGLPLVVELDGSPVVKYLISEGEQRARQARMEKICLSCHTSEWVDNHFARLENTIAESNSMTFEATKILLEIWNQGYASGLPHGQSIFDEEIERVWTSVWLFYANSTRFASAMAGGGDYGVFANGRYETTNQLYRLAAWLRMQNRIHGKQ